MSYVQKLKELKVGAEITMNMDDVNYDSVIATHTRLRRNGKGRYSVQKDGKKIIVKKVE